MRQSWYKKAYNQEIAHLRNYLRHGFDPYDYEYCIPDFLSENYPDEYEKLYAQDEDKLEDYEIAEQWIQKASQEQQEKFKDYVQKQSFTHTDVWGPAYQHFEYESFIKPTWLIHFTDNPQEIKQNGFSFGHEEFSGLGLTTWKANRKKSAGYNFSFKVNDRDIKFVAEEHKYGKHAVVFWGAGIETYHSGDEENQIIIWGPSIDTNMIFAIYSGNDEWTVNDDDDKERFKGDIEDVIKWVTNNWRMLQNIEEKNQRVAISCSWYKMSMAEFFYHGTPSAASAKKIFDEGLTPPDLSDRKENLTKPREGKVYLSPSLRYAIIYCLNGDMLGHQLPEEWIKKDRYGYVFEINTSNMGHIEPDEDSIGEALYDKRFTWLNELAERNVAPSRIKRVYDGEYAYFASVGKQLMHHLSDWEKNQIIESGGHIAHEGTVPITRAWRFDKTKSKSLATDGSNFFDLAEQIQ